MTIREYEEASVRSKASLTVNGIYLVSDRLLYTFSNDECVDIVNSLEDLEIQLIELKYHKVVFRVVTEGIYYGLKIVLNYSTCLKHLHQEKR